MATLRNNFRDMKLSTADIATLRHALNLARGVLGDMKVNASASTAAMLDNVSNDMAALSDTLKMVRDAPFTGVNA